ncbi:hypothetical protein AVEN_230236-1 [Araneus ventricosus]|uniref:Uncharacterized protein n=1 Tax=Araneus ventricosus TaxID=182803 RepID=A0A4Y2DX53_ARAVE|nr:hypothetical protein AVEN_230236-1 [Araneus ventricosus]
MYGLWPPIVNGAELAPLRRASRSESPQYDSHSRRLTSPKSLILPLDEPETAHLINYISSSYSRWPWGNRSCGWLVVRSRFWTGRVPS